MKLVVVVLICLKSPYVLSFDLLYIRNRYGGLKRCRTVVSLGWKMECRIFKIDDARVDDSHNNNLKFIIIMSVDISRLPVVEKISQTNMRVFNLYY